MKEYTKQVMHQLNAAFYKEEARILAEKRAASKAEIKELSWFEFIVNLKSRNIADNIFKVLETIPPNERMPITLEMIESLDKKEMTLPPLIFLRSALYLANFPQQIYSNIAIIKPGLSSKERAQIAIRIILSLSKSAEEAAKRQNIKNRFDIGAYEQKSNAVKNTASDVISRQQIIEPANNPKLILTEAVHNQNDTVIPTMPMLPIEALNPELPKLLQQLEAAETQASNMFEKSCDALRDYAKTVGSALHNLSKESEICEDYISEYLLNQIAGLNTQGSRLVLKVEARLSERVSYVTGEALTYEHIKKFTDEVQQLQQEVELHQQQFIKIANMKVSNKSSSRMSFLYKSVNKSLNAFNAALNRIQEIARKIWTSMSRDNTIESSDPTKRKTLLHSKTINKSTDYLAPDKKPDNSSGPNII